MNSTQDTPEAQATLQAEASEIDLEALLAGLEELTEPTAEERAEQARRSAEALDSFLAELADDDGKAPIVPAPKTPTAEELEAQKLEWVRRTRIETERRLDDAKMGFRLKTPKPTTPPQVEAGKTKEAGQPAAAATTIEARRREAPSKPASVASVTVAPPDSFQLDEALLAKFRATDDAALVRTLAELKDSQKPFCDVLPVFIAASLVMDERGLLAPAYRPRHALPRWGSEVTPDDTALLRALQVVDLHWLWSRGRRGEINDKRWATLFTGTDFDFVLAWRLACDKHVRPAAKAEALNLSTLEQLQLAILKGGEVKTREKRAREKRPTVERRLDQRLTRNRKVAHCRDGWLDMWQANELHPDGTSEEIGLLIGLMRGTAPLHPRTVRDALKASKKWTD